MKTGNNFRIELKKMKIQGEFDCVLKPAKTLECKRYEKIAQNIVLNGVKH